MNNRVKIPGYAKRIFFNDNIEYRNFSPDLVGLQLTSDGGTTLFTNGNFSISVNLDPKPNVLFKQGTKSRFYTLDDIVDNSTQQNTQENLKLKLNLDMTNPLSYVWYGSGKELVRASLVEIEDDFPAAIYVDDRVGSVTGNNITNYVYDIEKDESTFNLNSRYFINPYNIRYTIDSQYTGTETTGNTLRNFTVNYSSYNIEHNDISRKIKSITPSTQITNSTLELVVEGNPFPELTGIFIPEFSFLSNNVDASIPFFIKPNEDEIENFFSGLDTFQTNLLNRNIYPKYTSEFYSTTINDDGVEITSKVSYTFPLLDDEYNLDFFSDTYITYLTNITELFENLDETRTDIIIRKYIAEAVSSFDTMPRGDNDDLDLNGEKATKLLRIYGVEFDEIKKYIDGIKFAHVVTYDKKNNVPDVLVKDLAFMLGLEPINFINDSTFSKLLLPSNGQGQLSGTSVNMTNDQINTELYRRLILNIAWLWKSKGTRKAVEFLFRFIGAPESLVNFNEYVVLVDKPMDMEGLKRLLYLYTGEVNLDNIPFDVDGFPLPPPNGTLVRDENDQITEMYFQKGGGWYRQTYGSNSVTVLNGNNPHIGPYDGGNEYLNYFRRCFVPNFTGDSSVTFTAITKPRNYFVNYNYGIFNGIDTNSEIFTNQLTYNPNTNRYQPISSCLDVNYSIIETPLQNDGKTTYQQSFEVAEQQYDDYLKLIKDNSYLIYSPEWEIIRSNYEIASINKNNEIVSENCNDNQTLEICLNNVEPSNIEYSCDNLTLVECSPFIYYTNSNGNKVSFDEFPNCCKTQNGKFVSYINEYGRTTEYCSKLAPCVGKPIETLTNGIIVFEMENNLEPANIIQRNNKCYQVTRNGQVILDSRNLTAESYMDTINFNNIPIEFYVIFKIINCNRKTTISSPECCAWYGYDYRIVDNEGTKVIVCVTNNNLSSTELILSKELLLTPFIDLTINNSYYGLQNPVGSVYEYYSTEIFWECFNDSRIVKELVSNVGIIPQPNSILSDPDLMTPSNWEVHSIDQYGRVSFSPILLTSNYIIDWYSDEQLSDLYKIISDHFGYTFGKFSIDYSTNTLIPFKTDGTYSINPNSYFTASVDKDRISCDSFNNVSVVFGSENWKGFKLPEQKDCSCSVDFSFDYMLKYKTENLIQCNLSDNCYPGVLNYNTYSNINCLNFIVFTTNEIDSSILQNNFNVSEDPKTEYVLWNNTNILEPSTECCLSMNGNVTSVDDWVKINSIWVKIIEENYSNLSNPTTEFLLTLNFPYTELINYVNTYNSIKNEITLLVSGCYRVNFTLPKCDINYDEYIRTTNICSLDLPLECGLWSRLLMDYTVLKNNISRILSTYYRVCQVFTDNTVKKGNTSVEIIKGENYIISQRDEQLDELKNIETELTNGILGLDDIINSKTSDNTIISKSLTEVDSTLDCSVYENKIIQLNNFDYKTYCNSNVETIKDPSIRYEEYQSCIKTKTSENENQKVIYSQLLVLCNDKNKLESQLVTANFQNNNVLVSELEDQIVDINSSINTLTNSAISFLSYDETLQKSLLSINDTNNTIERISEILNVTTNSITDENGNIVLTDNQKVKLNIEYTKNQSQISSLLNQKRDLESLMVENLNGQKQVVNNTDEELIVYRQNTGTDTPPPDPRNIVYGCTLPSRYLDPIDGYEYQIINSSTGLVQMCPEFFSNTSWIYIGSSRYQRGCCIGQRISGTTTNNTGGLNDGKNDGPITGCFYFNELDITYTSDNSVLVKGQPLSQECCTVQYTNQNVYWDGSRCKITQPIDCRTIDQSLITLSPNGTVLLNGVSLPKTCCDSKNLGYTVFWDGTSCKIKESDTKKCCDQSLLNSLTNYLNTVDSSLVIIEEKTKECYDIWYNNIMNNFNEYQESTANNYLNFIDDLKINFKLFVDNNNIQVQNNIDTSLTYLPYTQSINPIWSWNPSNNFSGIIFEGTEQEIATITESIFNQLSSQNITYNPNIFEENWNRFSFTIPECLCDDLRTLYPNREFYFSIEIENFECSICLLVDNILVNVKDCKTQRIISLTDCLIPELSCAIDNKKSWVYTESGLVTETIYPDGSCNTGSTNNYDVVKFTTPEERLWLDLEYRYTNYEVYHSNLVMNVKNTTFSIDPSKSIECDVFNYWKNIDCDCNTSNTCSNDSNYIFQSSEDYIFMEGDDFIFQDQSTISPISFSGSVVYTSTTPSDYVLTLSDSITTGLSFSCDTYTSSLLTQVIELKNEYYTLTSDYNESLSSTYYDLLEKGETLSKFEIQTNNCGNDTLIINNTGELNNLFGIITENNDGTLSLYETYIYTGTSIYTGGTLVEIISGLTAQTFTQTDSVTSECCSSLNLVLNSQGVNGLGLGKNYVWDSTYNVCTWKELTSSSNDCQYCGSVNVCTSGEVTSQTTICINPLDYLDLHPSEINIKDNFDKMVLSNLIDVKSRQTISDYPLLRLFYDLYLNASNCGKDLSGKFTYNTMFEFMDSVGDYWLDVIEQVVPSTTIWDGCDNSGKIYRNTIFDQNKFNYKKYSINYIEVTNSCNVSGYTDFSIGQQTIESVVEQNPIYPTSVEINKIRTRIRNTQISINIVNSQIDVLNGKLCSLELQDTNSPNLQDQINQVIKDRDILQTQLITFNQELSLLFEMLRDSEREFLSQQENYVNNFMSCSGLSQTLTIAQNNLNNFIPGTTSYERQRNFISGIRSKYESCVRKSNKLVSDYNTVFITQIYDSNEYEGNITILGDPDWDEGGPFYNTELIHNC
jgi:hypothetical protein